MSWATAGNPIAAAGSGVVGGAIERDWAKRDTVVDQDFEREQVARQEEFQTTSATTAHRRNKQYATTAYERNLSAHGSRYQRSMADMKKAGLNPMLAYQQGGGSTPSASTPSAASPSGAKGSARGTKPTSIDLAGAAFRGTQAVLNTQQIEVAKANIRVLDSTANLNSAKAVQVEREGKKTVAETTGQLTANEIAALKEEQRRTTGDSAFGRWITSVLRTSKMGYVEFKKLMKATHKMGRQTRARVLKFLDKHGYHVQQGRKRSKNKRKGKVTNPSM